jgi:ATP/maltotriose-dependent transcriptional regulator MalT
VLAEIRLDRAQLLLDEGRLQLAAQVGNQALNEFQKEKSGDRQAAAEATLAQVAAREGKTAEALQLARAANEHLGPGEALTTRLEVKKAEAIAAYSSGKQTQALQILQKSAREARGAGLQEAAWDMELLMSEMRSSPSAEARAQQIKREASSRGILRIAELGPRLSAAR